MDNYEEIAKQAQFVPMTDGAGAEGPGRRRRSWRASHLEAASRAEVPGAGAPIARRLTISRRRYGETLIKCVLLACAAVSVLTTIGIVVALAEPTIEFFQDVSVGEFFTGTEWSPLFKPASFGVLPLVVGTLSATLLGVPGRASRSGWARRSTCPSTRGRARAAG